MLDGADSEERFPGAHGDKQNLGLGQNHEQHQHISKAAISHFGIVADTAFILRPSPGRQFKADVPVRGANHRVAPASPLCKFLLRLQEVASAQRAGFTGIQEGPGQAEKVRELGEAEEKDSASGGTASTTSFCFGRGRPQNIAGVESEKERRYQRDASDLCVQMLTDSLSVTGRISICVDTDMYKNITRIFALLLAPVDVVTGGQDGELTAPVCYGSEHLSAHDFPPVAMTCSDYSEEWVSGSEEGGPCLMTDSSGTWRIVEACVEPGDRAMLVGEAAGNPGEGGPEREPGSAIYNHVALSTSSCCGAFSRVPRATLSVLRAHASFITGEVGEQGSLRVCCDLREEGGKGIALTVSTVGLLSPARSLEGQPGLWIFNSTNPPGAPDGVTGWLMRNRGEDSPKPPAGEEGAHTVFPEPAEEANMDRNPRPCVSALFFLSPLLYFTLPEPLKAQLAGETVMTVHGLVFMGGILGSVSTEMSPRAHTAGTPKGPSTISSQPSFHSMENGSPEESGVWQGSHTWLLPMAELRAPPKCPEAWSAAAGGGCKTVHYDLVFLLDTSSSVGKEDFEKVRQWVANLVDTFEVGPERTRVGVVRYSDQPTTAFELGLFGSREAVKAAARHLAYHGGNTNTGDALRFITRHSFSPQAGGRPGDRAFKQVAILLPAGRSQDLVLDAAAAAHRAGIRIFAVGVGAALKEELEEIASEPKSAHVFHVSDFNAIDKIRGKLRRRLCESFSSALSLFLRGWVSGSRHGRSAAEVLMTVLSRESLGLPPLSELVCATPRVVPHCDDPSVSDDWVRLIPQGSPAGEEQPWELNRVLFDPGPEFLPRPLEKNGVELGMTSSRSLHPEFQAEAVVKAKGLGQGFMSQLDYTGPWGQIRIGTLPGRYLAGGPRASPSTLSWSHPTNAAGGHSGNPPPPILWGEAHPSGLDGVIPNTPTCLDRPVFFPSMPQSFPLVIIACWRGQRLIWPISTLSAGQQLPEDRALVIVPMISQSSSVAGWECEDAFLAGLGAVEELCLLVPDSRPPSSLLPLFPSPLGMPSSPPWPAAGRRDSWNKGERMSVSDSKSAPRDQVFVISHVQIFVFLPFPKGTLTNSRKN
ncbi:hypothetical protein PANDA_020540 [Ailuropoda melanoleuca]|uniref:VWFA domain-containing protein n=1 Tax=Ailuropoda melanoleuca TaxID=9646 RepID=D2I4K8_AILME|nr:hypothetical protein PANDA_020540 [Ailuropoda melanoleuca]